MKNIGKARNRLVRRVIGFLGLLCLSISVFGYWRVQVKDKEENAKATASKSNVTNEVSSDYYPLDVGRYWVYTRQDPMEGDPVEVRRQIVRHEHHVNRDVYFFEDGSIAYRDGNKVFEVSPEGGVDVVFASKVNVGEAFLYRKEN